MNLPTSDRDGQVRLSLREVLRDYGPPGLDDVALLDALLPDLLAGFPREIRLVLAAASVGTARLLADRTAHGLSPDAAVRDVTALLAADSMYEPGNCRWIVTAYAETLGLEVTAAPTQELPFTTLDPPTAETVPRAPGREPPTVEVPPAVPAVSAVSAAATLPRLSASPGQAQPVPPFGAPPIPAEAVHTGARRRRVLALAGAGLVALLIAGTVLILGHRTPARSSTTSPPHGSSPHSSVTVGGGPGPSSPAAQPKCGYHLAFLGALTGVLGQLGTGVADGAQLAVDEFNARYGPDCVRLIRYDTQAGATTARARATELVGDSKTLGVIGPLFSPESETADPVLNAAGIPLVTPKATLSSLSARGWRVFHRAIGTDDDAARGAARYIRDVLGASRVYVVNDQTAFGVGMATGVRDALGALVVGSHALPAKVAPKDLAKIVPDVLASGATVLFYGGYYTAGGTLRRQLTAAGWRGTMVGGDGMKDPGFLAAAGVTAAEGTVDVAPDPPSPPAGGAFAADFRAEFGVAPPESSDVGYDVANMFLRGIVAGRTSTSTMLAWIDDYDGDGVARHYHFTAAGDLDPADVTVWTYTVTSGQFVASSLAPSR